MISFEHLPREILVQIASYLTSEELAHLREVSFEIRNVADLDCLWKPLLERLQIIDPYLVFNFGDSHRNIFIHNFNIISDNQLAEFNHFKRYFTHLHDISMLPQPEQQSILLIFQNTLPAKSLHELEERNCLLNMLNSHLIRKEIKKSIRNEHPYDSDEMEGILELGKLGLTRIPEDILCDTELTAFWSNVICLDITNDFKPDKNANEEIGKLKYLPNSINFCQNLRGLLVADNSLQTLPSSLGDCSELRSLDLTNNDLKDLPESIGNCQMLAELHVGANRLQHLPLSFTKLTNLTTLYLYDNELQELPVELETRFGTHWHQTTLHSQRDHDSMEIEEEHKEIADEIEEVISQGNSKRFKK